ADSIEAATSFAEGQQIPHASINVYEVAMVGASHTGPMALIHALQKKFDARLNLDNLVREYWLLTRPWTFMETIGSAFNVVQAVPTASPASVIAFKMQYQRDVDQAKDFDTWRSMTNSQFLTQITCVGRDGKKRNFLFDRPTREDGPPVRIQVHVRAELQNTSEHFMELELVEDQPGLLRIHMIHHHGAAHLRQMGIPEVLLPLLKKRWGKQIQSSPVVGAAGVWRSPSATAMWKRLVAANLAQHDSSSDIFSLT
ncbi:MAG: hypothetical protein ACRERT_04500, partial [Pseudomonas sp.]